MQNLMIRVQDEARGIRNLQDNVLPKLRTQLSETTGIFKGKERKALTEQIQQTEAEISERLDKLPDILKEDGYPDVQAFMAVSYTHLSTIHLKCFTSKKDDFYTNSQRFSL